MKAIFCVFFIFFLASASQAKDHIVSKSYFEDPSGQLTLESLPQDDFKEFSGVLGKGYSSSAFWIRLRIDPESALFPLTLRIRPNYLDEVVLFDPVFNSIGLSVTGDETKVRDNYASLNLSLPIPASKEARDVWLRVRTKSTFLFSLEGLQLDEVIRKDQVQELKSAFYLSLIGLFIIWGALNWWATRDQVIGFFVLKQLFCLIFMAGMLGYVRYFWPTSWAISPGAVVDVSMGLYGAGAFLFEYQFLRGFRPNRYLLWIMRWLPLFLVIYVALFALGLRQWAFEFCMFLFFTSPILTFLLALTASPSVTNIEGQQGHLSRKILVSIYGIILFAMVSTTLPIMGWVLPGGMIFDGPLVYSLVSGLAILILLQIRIKNRERERLALEMENREVRKQFEIERQGREQQARFLAMLTHELRTPMTAIRMSLIASDCDPAVYSEADQSIDEMVAILDRCLTADQLEHGELKSYLTVFYVGKEIRSIAERHGDSSRVVIQMDVMCRSKRMSFCFEW